MIFTNKMQALAEAEQLLVAAGVDNATLATIVTDLSDDAISLELVNFLLAGDAAVDKLKALFKGTESPPDSVKACPLSGIGRHSHVVSLCSGSLFHVLCGCCSSYFTAESHRYM